MIGRLKPWPIVWTACGALVLIALSAAAWIGVRALWAKTELEAVAHGVGQVMASVTDGELETSRAKVAALGAHAERAAELTGDPIWRAAEAVPGVGPNLAGFRVAAAAADALLGDVAPPVFETALRLESDGLDLAALRAARPELTHAADRMRGVADELAAVDTAPLFSPLAAEVINLTDAAQQLVPAIQGVADAATVLPGFLGIDEERTLLVMVQNNAELRTGGGITGSFIELTVRDGALELSQQADSSDFTGIAPSGPHLADSTLALYGASAQQWVQNISLPTDFATTAELAVDWWQAQGGRQPDAVISVDPLVLKALMTVTGPVSTTTGPLGADDLVDRLLVRPYFELTARDQTALFEQVTGGVFAALNADTLDPLALAQALSAPLADGRISVWSAHPDENAVLEQTILAGPAARHRDAGENAFAVYLNDLTGAKLGSHLDVGIAAGSAQCSAERGEAEIAVTLTSRAPAEAVGWPLSVTGGGMWGIAPGDIATAVAVAAPAGAYYDAVTVDGRQVAPTTVDEAGFPTSATTVLLHPGETSTVVFRFRLETVDVADPVILHTPLLGAPTVQIGPVSCR